MGKWLLNIAISIDQFFNTICGGDPDETISSRLGKTKRRYGGTIPWRHPWRKIIDWGLDKIDPNHSIDAIEEDEGKDALLALLEKRQNERNNGNQKTFTI